MGSDKCNIGCMCWLKHMQQQVMSNVMRWREECGWISVSPEKGLEAHHLKRWTGPAASGFVVGMW